MIVVAGQGPAYDEIRRLTPSWTHAGTGPLGPGRLLLSVQYPRIVKQLDDYDHAVNIHFGALPEYRGCFPTKWAIINGDPAGVTLHHMAPAVDAGNILEIVRFPTDFLTDLQVYEHACRIAVHLFRKWRERFETGQIPEGEPQDESRARYYPRELPYGGKHDPTWDEEFTDRMVRAFTHPPYPGLG